MNKIVIRQNRCNWRNAVSLFAAIFMVGLASAGLSANWPPHVCFEWFLLPILLFGASGMAAAYAYQIFRPRDHTISISSSTITIEDSIYGKWKTHELIPDEIAEFVIHENDCMFLMKSHKAHLLGPNLSIRHKEIVEALSSLHPHIKVTYR